MFFCYISSLVSITSLSKQRSSPPPKALSRVSSAISPLLPTSPHFHHSTLCISMVAHRYNFQGGPYGENLASGYPNASASVIAWGHEREEYDFKKAEFRYAPLVSPPPYTAHMQRILATKRATSHNLSGSRPAPSAALAHNARATRAVRQAGM